MMHKILLPLGALILFAGCSAQKQPTINIESKPKLQVPKKVEAPKPKKGSLYSRKGASLFSDKKDLQIGDIIQVYIDETLTNESTEERETTRTTNSSLGGGVFAPNEPTSTVGRVATNLNRMTNIGFSTGSTSDFSGEATTSTDEEFTTVVSAIIEETYQNGNYLIKGTKEMLINGQKQNIWISGVIRPYDISPDNTVYSYQLANLKIYYEKEGADEALDKPWGTKTLETIWPF